MLLGRVWRRLAREDGNTAVELALVAPIILSLIGASIDLGTAYTQHSTLAMAAKAGAEAAAQVLVGRPLSGGAVPQDAVQAAVDAVRSASRELNTAQISIRVEWAGPSVTSQRQLAPYEMRLRIPVVENTSQTVDTRHAHFYDWSYPTFTGDVAWPTYQPGVWYLDRINWSYPTGFGFYSAHWYPDRNSQALWGYPNGPVAGFPWGIWVGVWWSISGWFVRGFDRWDAWRRTNNAWAGSSAWVAGWPYDAWRRTFTDAFGIADRYWNQSGWAATSETSGIGGPVLDFTYGVRRPDQEVTIQSLPATQTVEQRPLRVTLSYPFTPVTPILAPILRGRSIGASVTVTVTGAY